MSVARFVAAAFGVVAGADFCCASATELRNKSLQQKSGVSSALGYRACTGIQLASRAKFDSTV